MSNAARIQAEYEQLEQIAAQFIQQCYSVTALWQLLHNCIFQLRDGGWKGKGADRFYHEMESLVMPALNRLIRAMDAGSLHTWRIAQVFRAAEREAADLFVGSDTAVGGISSSTGHRMDLGGISGIALSAILGARMSNIMGIGSFNASKALSIAVKSQQFASLEMFKSYLGSDSRQYKSKFGHNFVKLHLLDTYTSGHHRRFISRNASGRVVLSGGRVWYQRGAALHSYPNFQAAALKDKVFGKLISYDISGNREATVGRHGVKIGASGEAGMYVARKHVSAKLGGVQVAGKAYVGAQVQGEAATVLQAKQAYIDVGSELFAGAKAEGRISYARQILSGLSLEGTASGYVSYGIGANLGVKFGYYGGKIRLGGSIGATLGIGTGAKFDITTDVKSVISIMSRGAQTAQQAANNVFEFGRRVADIRRFYAHTRATDSSEMVSTLFYFL